jgi:hypothetical protein
MMEATIAPYPWATFGLVIISVAISVIGLAISVIGLLHLISLLR